jgi:hypothetical protein
MNAETRAKEIVDDLASRVMAHGWEEDFHHPLLRQAEALISAVIIQAENDKLEEAAAATAGAALRAIDDGSPRRQVAVAVANAARSLKSKD